MFREITLTPFILFLLLLIVLLISIIYGSNKNIISIEGVTNISTSTDTTDITTSKLFTDYYPKLYSLDEISSPSYVNILTKIYGNNYFDKQNGNLIRFLASTGKTIPTGINILHRNSNNPQSVSLPQNPPLITSTKLGTSYYPVFSTIEQGCCQIFYISWRNQTYIHVIDIKTDTNVNALSCLFSPEITNQTPLGATKIVYQTNNAIKISQPTSIDNDPNNNTVVLDPVSGNLIIYQLSKNVSFNVSNGYLLITNDNKNIITYDRTGAVFKGKKVDTSIVILIHGQQ